MDVVLRWLLLAVAALLAACGSKDSGDDDASGAGTSSMSAGGRPGSGGSAGSGGSSGAAGSASVCPTGQSACNGACTNLSSDSSHCGSCTNACGAGMACEGGVCRPQCGGGQALCGALCKTVVSDPNNCGVCDMACPSGQFCVSGKCSATCPLLTCSGTGGTQCADVMSDPSNCGACGSACKMGESCVLGKCVTACPTGQVSCDGRCTDLMTTQTSCGACGTTCPTGTPCIAGHCGCATGQELCNGACVDTASDAKNCGGCGKPCGAGLVCQGGQCQSGCSTGLSSCGGGCVDTSTSAANCGGCGQPCPAAQACAGGKCACANGGVLCGSECVDVQSDEQHCGGCATVCSTGQSCVAGKCACPGGGTACGAACVDTMSSNDHCGGCNQPCSGGATCKAGACTCPTGQTACSGACVDTLMNDANCGGCGKTCTTGQVCLAGKCSGSGGVGADGCTGGLARNITLSRIDAFQSVQVGIMLNSAEVAASARNTDLVVGRETVFRLFVTPGTGFTAREISARVTIVNGDTSDEYFVKKTVSAASSVNDANSTLQVTVPAEKIQANTSYHVELVECSDSASGDAVVPRYPTTDDAALGARQTGGLKIKVIPLRANSRVPTTDDTFLKPFKDMMLAMYPITSVDISVGDEVAIDYPIDWNAALDQVRAKRQADAPAADIYYYGMVKPNDTFQQFCGGGCTAGVGFVPPQNDAAHRVAMGIGFTGSQSVTTMAHEVGHNHGRNHAPCVPQGGSISGVDSAFPYSGANIGVWGYDARMKMLINPNGVTDIMGYCNTQWISDYTYDGLVNRVAFVDGAKEELVNPDVLARWRTLLVDAHGPRWGLPVEDLAPPSGTAEVAQIFDDRGNVSDYVVVYRTEIAELGAASIMVPEPQPGWYAVGVTGSTPHPFAASVAVPKGF